MDTISWTNRAFVLMIGWQAAMQTDNSTVVGDSQPAASRFSLDAHTGIPAGMSTCVSCGGGNIFQPALLVLLSGIRFCPLVDLLGSNIFPVLLEPCWVLSAANNIFFFFSVDELIVVSCNRPKKQSKHSESASILLDNSHFAIDHFLLSSPMLASVTVCYIKHWGTWEL